MNGPSIASAWEMIGPARRSLALVAAGLLVIYFVGIAQGGVLNSLVQGAGQPGLLHEVFHDFRHANGFPCH